MRQPLALFLDVPIPVLRWNHHDPSLWILEEDFDLASLGLRLSLTAGSTSNLASIPRVLRWLYDSNGLWTPASFVHDDLYRNLDLLKITRYEADHYFLILMLIYNVRPRNAFLFYCSVRLFGWLYLVKQKPQ